MKKNTGGEVESFLVLGNIFLKGSKQLTPSVSKPGVAERILLTPNLSSSYVCLRLSLIFKFVFASYVYVD